MNKRRRRAMGLGNFRREEVWRRMAEEERRIGAARAWLALPWWRKAWARFASWMRRPGLAIARFRRERALRRKARQDLIRLQRLAARGQ